MGVTKRTEKLRVEAHVNGEAVRQVSSFRYLGSLISEDGRCDAEIKSRIAMAKGNFGKMRRILTNLSLGMNIRLRLLKCYVWSTLLYGCEAWNISGYEEEAGGGGDVAHKKDVKNTMDGEKNERGSLGNGWYIRREY